MGSTVAVALARCWRGSTWRNHWRQPGGKVPSPVETTRCQLDTPPPTCCTWWLWSTNTPLLASTLANGLRPAWMLMNLLLKSFIVTLWRDSENMFKHKAKNVRLSWYRLAYQGVCRPELENRSPSSNTSFVLYLISGNILFYWSLTFHSRITFTFISDDFASDKSQTLNKQFKAQPIKDAN